MLWASSEASLLLFTGQSLLCKPLRAFGLKTDCNLSHVVQRRERGGALRDQATYGMEEHGSGLRKVFPPRAEAHS
jgi:hypothetical protein